MMEISSDEILMTVTGYTAHGPWLGQACLTEVLSSITLLLYIQVMHFIHKITHSLCSKCTAYGHLCLHTIFALLLVHQETFTK